LLANKCPDRLIKLHGISHAPRGEHEEEAARAWNKPVFYGYSGGQPVLKFLLWCILLVLCWPLALLALILYPIVWLLLLPFRIVGIAVAGILDLIGAVISLPARLLRMI
jgi:hypothetical protein